MSDSALRDLERAKERDPSDLAALRRWADCRKRLGLELLPVKAPSMSLEDMIAYLTVLIGARFGLPRQIMAETVADCRVPRQRTSTRGVSAFNSTYQVLERLSTIERMTRDSWLGRSVLWLDPENEVR